MKCVCTKVHQRRLNGKITLVSRGQVFDFEKCPDLFSPMDNGDSYVIDFTKAEEEELMAAKWAFKDASAVMLETYGIELKREEGTKKSEVVAQILDIRFRSTDIDPAKVK